MSLTNTRNLTPPIGGVNAVPSGGEAVRETKKMRLPPWRLEHFYRPTESRPPNGYALVMMLAMMSPEAAECCLSEAEMHEMASVMKWDERETRDLLARLVVDGHLATTAEGWTLVADVGCPAAWRGVEVQP